MTTGDLIERMDPDKKAKWVAALKSGKFPQGGGRLKGKDGTYCCLGVLCEVAIADGLDIPSMENDCTCGAESCVYYKYDGEGAYLPKSVCEWAGLSKTNSDPIVDGQELSGWNDETRATFDQIADLIDKHL